VFSTTELHLSPVLFLNRIICFLGVVWVLYTFWIWFCYQTYGLQIFSPQGYFEELLALF
jgi:hypothetical protein